MSVTVTTKALPTFGQLLQAKNYARSCPINSSWSKIRFGQVLLIFVAIISYLFNFNFYEFGYEFGIRSYPNKIYYLK